MLLLCGDKMTALRTSRQHLQPRTVHLKNPQLHPHHPKYHHHEESPLGLHRQ
jgi:hypothetical protein